ncbi:MAG: DUF4854 domain-containing protein [Lachnospiraceae bacterium]|jgi:ABC-type oligopeptide transport system substrate-binding subunit|nr:DUF4854 domain-containing protein [Lachnospiraceae bacterium]
MARKNWKLILCAVFAFALAGLAACGDKESKDVVKSTNAVETEAVETTAAETKAVETKAAETTAAETQAESTADSGKFATVAEFANSEEVQSELAAQKKSLEGSGMDIAITGEDNKLIYTFTYLEMENQEGMAEALQQGLEAEKTTFSGVAKSIKLAVDVENPVVVVRYLDSTGAEIYSAEFTAE